MGKRRELGAFFRRKKQKEEKGLIPLPPPGPAPSFFEVFKPKPQYPAPLEPPPAAPPEPPRGGILRMFEAFAPAPVRPEAGLPAIPEEPPPTEPVVWEEMFGAPSLPEEPPITTMFIPPTAEQQLPVPVPTPPSAPIPRPGEWPRHTFIRIPKLPGVVGQWTPPSPQELAEHLKTIFLLDAIFPEVSAVRSTPDWGQKLIEHTSRGQPMAHRIDPVVYQNLYTDFAKLFNIPWEVVEGYIGHARTKGELAKATEVFMEDQVMPLIDRLVEAFEILKPQDLPGWFSVDYDHEKGTWYLYYIETMPPPYPPVHRLPFEGGPGA